MLRRNLKNITLGAAALTIAVAGSLSQANAFWGHSGGGSSGGSNGSGGGSSGGSYGGYGGGYSGYAGYGGSWGSSGGSAGASWGGRHHHHRARRAYGGNYGGGAYAGWGSSGGYGSYGSSGGSSGGSYGSWGSNGGTVIEGPAAMDPTTPGNPPPPPETPAPMLDPNAPAPEPGELPPDAPATGDSTRFFRSATLSVHVPADAKVFVNGLATKSAGADRRYVSNGLQAGYNYSYEVRAELVRDGRTISETKVVKLQAGDSSNVAFELNGDEEQVAEQPVSTSLTLHVPAEAKVYLSGNATKSFGETRRFSTTKLAGGQAWQDYVVRVELEQDGQILTKEEIVSLKAGDARELTINFDAPQVAQTAVDR